jgi:tryptophan synthase alpha subunit
MKESNFGSKSHSEHFEELNLVFKEVLAQLHEIESVMMFYVNPFNNVGNSSFIKAINAIYEANFGRLELDFWNYRKT